MVSLKTLFTSKNITTVFLLNGGYYKSNKRPLNLGDFFDFEKKRYLQDKAGIVQIKKKLYMIFDIDTPTPRVLVPYCDQNKPIDSKTLGIATSNKTLKSIFGAGGWGWIEFTVGISITSVAFIIIAFYLVMIGKIAIH